jgi:hypothetical protein
MTVHTDAAAQALRQELHDRNLAADPSASYHTIAELIDVVRRTADLVTDLNRAAENASHADDDREVVEHLAELDVYLASAKDMLRGAAAALDQAHTTIGHLAFAAPQDGA